MDLVKQMRGFESDHEPDGWPAIQMKQVSALCDEIEHLQSIIDEANARAVYFHQVDTEGKVFEEVTEEEMERYGTIFQRTLYARPIPAQQSPAVAVRDDRFSDGFNKFYSESMGCDMPPAHKVDCYTSWIAALKSPRITEQDAREIATYAVRAYIQNPNITIDTLIDEMKFRTPQSKI